ncbi:MAG TPA: MFS transporter [Microbacterium sp.]|nr:MFS transporter [Microbacterium sp.]
MTPVDPNAGPGAQQPPTLAMRSGGEPIDVPSPVPSVSSPPFNEGAAIGEQLTHPERPADDRPKVPASYIWLIVLAQFGAFMALVAPIGFSLSVVVDRLAPENDEFLGYVVGAGAFVVIIFGPLLGVLSDRTRSRLGRRRPWIVVLTLVGLVGLAVVAIAPNIAIVILGWAITQLGFGVGGLIVAASMGDRLPESQRGKVAGLTGVATMLASIVGVAVAAALASNSLLLFLVPGVIGAVLMLLFVAFVKEPDTSAGVFTDKVTLKSVLGGYVYNVAKFADFSWNWLGRFLFNFGLTLATTFTTFLFASKLGIPVEELGGIIAISGLLGIVGTVGGAALSGFLSDRLKRRKSFIIFSGAVFAIGATVAAFAPDLTILLVGGFIMNFGLGVFSAVDQALYLDVLPETDTQAGKFIAINQFSTSIPQFAAPLLAPVFLAIGVAGGDSNYSLLYLVAGGFALIGGLVILLRVKGVR